MDVEKENMKLVGVRKRMKRTEMDGGGWLAVETPEGND